jgi:hypothetical protein
MATHKTRLRNKLIKLHIQLQRKILEGQTL